MRAGSNPLRPLVVPLSLAGAVFLVYVWDRVAIPTELVELQRVFGLSLAAAGLLASVFTFGLALSAILSGFVVMRIGTRLSLVIGAIVFSLCTAYTAIGHGYADLLVARIGTGVGEGLYDVAFLSLLAYLSETYRAASEGVGASLFGIGLFSGPLFVGALMTASGQWQTAFYTLGALGILGGLGMLLTLRNEQFAIAAVKRGPASFGRLKNVLAARNLGVCLAMAVTGSALYSYVSLYQTYLRVDQHMAASTAYWIASMFGIGSILGGVPIGYIADRFGRRHFLPIIMVISGITGVAIFAAPATPVVAGVLSLILGTSVNGIVANAYAVIQDQVDSMDIPLATGVLTTIYNLVAASSGYVLPTLKNIVGWVMASILIYAVPYLITTIIVLLINRRGNWADLPEKAAPSH